MRLNESKLSTVILFVWSDKFHKLINQEKLWSHKS